MIKTVLVLLMFAASFIGAEWLLPGITKDTGYRYAQGEWVGVVTEISNTGYFWKTWEGQIKSQFNPDLKHIADLSRERSFSVDPKDVAKVVGPLYVAFLAQNLVVLHFERILYMTDFLHGEERAFVKEVIPYSEWLRTHE